MTDIEGHLHAQVAVSIGSDGRSVPVATNAGEPVVSRRRSKFGAGIWQLTSLITGASNQSTQTRPRPELRCGLAEECGHDANSPA